MAPTGRAGQLIHVLPTGTTVRPITRAFTVRRCHTSMCWNWCGAAWERCQLAPFSLHRCAAIRATFVDDSTIYGARFEDHVNFSRSTFRADWRCSDFKMDLDSAFSKARIEKKS